MAGDGYFGAVEVLADGQVCLTEPLFIKTVLVDGSVMHLNTNPLLLQFGKDIFFRALQSGREDDWVEMSGLTAVFFKFYG